MHAGESYPASGLSVEITPLLGMAILSMDLDTHGYLTRLGKGMEHISTHGSVDMDTHE